MSLAAGIQTGGGAVFQGLVNAASLRVPGSSQLNDVSAAAGVYGACPWRLQQHLLRKVLHLVRC